jgi:hypothetical protein
MAITLLADANIQGHIARLISRMQSAEWRDYWDYLRLRHITFADLGLDPADPDSVVWRCCQERQVLLLTNNRNDDGPESLEATIRAHNTPECLPVFTIGDADRLLSGTDYADQVIDRLLRYLLEFEAIRGTGRLYLP